MINLKDIRFQILAMCALLLMIGLVFIYDAGASQAVRLGRHELYFFIKQFISIIIGFAVLMAVYRIPLEFYRKNVMPIFFFTLILLIAVFFMPSAFNGAKRWISVSFFSFQPSELAKFTVVLYLAHYLDKKNDKMWDFMTGFLPATLLVGVLAALIMLEPDFGTTMLIVIAAFTMFLVGGARLSHIFGIVGIVLPILIAAMLAGEYRRNRLLNFLNPWEDQYGAGYQLIQSLASVGSGGVFGRGIGNSTQKLSFLPEAHTDFIYAIIAEESGLIGASLVFLVIVFFFRKTLQAAFMHEDKFKRLLVFGLSFMLFVQSFVHIFVVIGLMPTKGLTLPFVSYGGSAIVISLFFVGVILRSLEETSES
ncbi:MAG: putative lipid II flippase FtsW [Mucispirillum sp.]|nr:putative lipid II flippase FtsW [Mucispirillum sp.]